MNFDVPLNRCRIPSHETNKKGVELQNHPKINTQYAVSIVEPFINNKLFVQK